MADKLAATFHPDEYAASRVDAIEQIIRRNVAADEAHGAELIGAVLCPGDVEHRWISITGGICLECRAAI